ncbi:MAG: hypothetical protein K0U54_03130, partial [Bacteroidetes bacterium]|nr:hypothetical protein [Bacteroidota bacterium]
MPRFFVFFFSLIMIGFSASTFAQDVSFYKAQLETETDGLKKLVILDSIISKTRRKNTDDFVTYSLAYIELAKKLDSTEAAAKKLVNVSYSLTTIKNKPRETITLVDAILARKYQVKDSFLLGSLYLKRGGANSKLDLEQSIIDYQNAVKNYATKDSLYIADAFLFSGQAYSNLGEFVPAGESYKRAYEYFESLKDYEYMYYARQGVTTMFSMNGFYTKAKEERDKNILKIKELDIEHHLVTAYYNQSLDYRKQGNKTKFLEHLLLAEEAIRNDNKKKVNRTNKLLVYASLIDYYTSTGQIDKA